MNEEKLNLISKEIKPKVTVQYTIAVGEKFTKDVFAEKTGFKKIYLDGIKDSAEISKREKMMYRFVHEQIDFLKMKKSIACIGIDRFRRNGVRGNSPKVYQALVPINFTWEI